MFPTLPDKTKRDIGLLLVIGVGLGAASVNVVHALSSREGILSFLLGIFIPLVLSLVLVAGGIWLSRTDVSPEHVFMIGLWTVFMAGVVGVGEIFTILYQQVEGVQMSHSAYIISNAAISGGVVGFVIGGYNSRQQRARTRAERLQDQLTVLNRVLRHDIRNGATVIQGHADLITESPESDAHASRIQRQAEQLVKLGEHARTIEQLQQERDVSREPVDILDTVEEELARIERENPEFEVDASVAFDGEAYAHPLIGIAIENVIENAVEHNDDQNPTLEVTCRLIRQRAAQKVEIRIADNGPGIPEQEAEVLERGYETPLDHTSGLGLWVVNWIVTQSNGSVWFEENEPRGSVVVIRLDTVNTDPLANPLAAIN